MLTREQIQRLAAKFPTQPNREFLQKNREFAQQNREFENCCRAALRTTFSEGPGHSSARVGRVFVVAKTDAELSDLPDARMRTILRSIIRHSAKRCGLESSAVIH